MASASFLATNFLFGVPFPNSMDDGWQLLVEINPVLPSLVFYCLNRKLKTNRKQIMFLLNFHSQIHPDKMDKGLPWINCNRNTAHLSTNFQTSASYRPTNPWIKGRHALDRMTMVKYQNILLLAFIHTFLKRLVVLSRVIVYC